MTTLSNQYDICACCEDGTKACCQTVFCPWEIYGDAKYQDDYHETPGKQCERFFWCNGFLLCFVPCLLACQLGVDIENKIRQNKDPLNCSEQCTECRYALCCNCYLYLKRKRQIQNTSRPPVQIKTNAAYIQIPGDFVKNSM